MAVIFKPDGGLGNILFMHNAVYAFAKDHGLELCAVGNYATPDIRPAISQYKTLFKHVTLVDHQPPVNYREPSFTYSPIPPWARSISGFFQSYKYFQKYQWEIRDLLRSNEADLWSEKLAKFQVLADGRKTVCVHIRRTDYVGSQNHPVLDEKYYSDAVKNFPDHRFIIFSDEIEEVKKWEVWNGLDACFVDDEPDPLPTLFLMSCCANFIIANSTLSLMGYYMRENKNARIIHPTTWFNPCGPAFNISDLIDAS
jgi:hypothetical protein